MHDHVIPDRRLVFVVAEPEQVGIGLLLDEAVGAQAGMHEEIVAHLGGELRVAQELDVMRRHARLHQPVERLHRLRRRRLGAIGGEGFLAADFSIADWVDRRAWDQALAA